jgi:hypothetical protein
MTQFREDLLTRIIKIYGFEHEITIMFAEILENWVENEACNRRLERLVEAHEQYPMIECEDEE